MLWSAFFYSLKLSIHFNFQFFFVCLFVCLFGPEISRHFPNQSDFNQNEWRVFPHFRQFVCVNFTLSLASCVFSFLLIGSRDNSGFCLTRFSQKPNNSLQKVSKYQVLITKLSCFRASKTQKRPRDV